MNAKPIVPKIAKEFGGSAYIGMLATIIKTMTDTSTLYSPDNRFRLSYYDLVEPRMCMNMCRFSLNDTHSNNSIKFEPLWAIGFNGNSTYWSDNSNFFSLPIGDPKNCFFVYNVINNQFASVFFINTWILKGYCKNDYVEIEFCDDQIPERNEHDKYPTKNYTKPSNLIFKYSDLLWYDIGKLDNFSNLYKDEKIFDLKAVDNGWRVFKGQFPKSTEIIVWELKKFADYGDKQSIEWFESIKNLNKDIDFWINASNYIGFKERK